MKSLLIVLFISTPLLVLSSDNAAINPVKSLLQAPSYKLGSKQHFINLATLYNMPTPMAKFLINTHFAAFKTKMLQDEKRELGLLVDTDSYLWKQIDSSVDASYESNLTFPRPSVKHDPNLPEEWVTAIKNRLHKKGYNPNAFNLTTTNDNNDNSAEVSIPYILCLPFFNIVITSMVWPTSIALNPIHYKKWSDNSNIRHKALSYLAAHEVTHIEQKHMLNLHKITLYINSQNLFDRLLFGSRHCTQEQLIPLRDAQEKTADTFPAIESSEGAKNALFTIYYKNISDIKLVALYHAMIDYHNQKK